MKIHKVARAIVKQGKKRRKVPTSPEEVEDTSTFSTLDWFAFGTAVSVLGVTAQIVSWRFNVDSSVFFEGGAMVGVPALHHGIKRTIVKVATKFTKEIDHA